MQASSLIPIMSSARSTGLAGLGAHTQFSRQTYDGTPRIAVAGRRRPGPPSGSPRDSAGRPGTIRVRRGCSNHYNETIARSGGRGVLLSVCLATSPRIRVRRSSLQRQVSFVPQLQQLRRLQSVGPAWHVPRSSMVAVPSCFAVPNQDRRAGPSPEFIDIRRRDSLAQQIPIPAATVTPAQRQRRQSAIFAAGPAVNHD